MVKIGDIYQSTTSPDACLLVIDIEKKSPFWSECRILVLSGEAIWRAGDVIVTEDYWLERQTKLA